MSIQFEDNIQLAKFCTKLFEKNEFYATCRFDAYSINVRPLFNQVSLDSCNMTVANVEKVLKENKVKFKHVCEF